MANGAEEQRERLLSFLSRCCFPVGLHPDTYLGPEQTRPGPDLHVWICRLGAQTGDQGCPGQINTEPKEECGRRPQHDPVFVCLCVCACYVCVCVSVCGG